MKVNAYILFEKVDFPTPGAMFLGPSLNFSDLILDHSHLGYTYHAYNAKMSMQGWSFVSYVIVSQNSRGHHLRSIYIYILSKYTWDQIACFSGKTQHKRRTSFVLLLDIELFHIADVVKLSELSLEPLLKHHYENWCKKKHTQMEWFTSSKTSTTISISCSIFYICFPPRTWLEISPLSTPPWPSTRWNYTNPTRALQIGHRIKSVPWRRGVGYADLSRLVCWKWGREVRDDDWEMFSNDVMFDGWIYLYIWFG